MSQAEKPPREFLIEFTEDLTFECTDLVDFKNDGLTIGDQFRAIEISALKSMEQRALKAEGLTTQQAERVTQLEYANSILREETEYKSGLITADNLKIQQLEADKSGLSQALGFYADKNNWHDEVEVERPENKEIMMTRVHWDFVCNDDRLRGSSIAGNRARQALAQYGSKK